MKYTKSANSNMKIHKISMTLFESILYVVLIDISIDQILVTI